MPISVHIPLRHLKLQKFLFSQLTIIKMLYYATHPQDVSSSHCVGFTQFSSPTPQLFQIYLQKDFCTCEKHQFHCTAQLPEKPCYTFKKNFFEKKNFPLLMLHGHIWSRKKILIIKMAPDIKQHITDQFVLANLILFIYFIYLILPTSFALH